MQAMPPRFATQPSIAWLCDSRLAGFGVFRGMWQQSAALDVNSLAAWFLMPLFQGVIGVAMASVVLPATRIYGPLERTTGGCGGRGRALTLQLAEVVSCCTAATPARAPAPPATPATHDA